MSDKSVSVCVCVCVFVFVWRAQVRSVKLELEVEKNKILSEALQTLATEHHELEQSVVKGSSPRSALSEDEFHDAVSGELTSYQTLLRRCRRFCDKLPLTLGNLVIHL